MIPFAEIRAWMFQDALPLWGTAGVDHKHGGFLEELSLDGRETDVAFKRTRALARQIYVFSHAAVLGWEEGRALSQRGYEYLIEKAWLGADRGWAKRLTRDGDLLDASPDLYDIAFVLFALAWRHRLTGDEEPLRYAHQTLDFVQTYLRHESGEGFKHALPFEGPRLQNPHMHLLEACLTAFAATNDQRFLEQADDIVGLFRRHFFDGRTLAENFDDGWARAPGEAGRIVEPGHHFEWAWLLGEYHRQRRADVMTDAAALVDFAERFGVDPSSHAVFDEVRDDGAPLKTSSRTWPNTERIKGMLALFEFGDADTRPAIEASTRLLLERYLAVSPRGSWMDQFDANGAPMAKAAPTSTMYHVFLAFAEILRLEAPLTLAR